MKIRFSYMISTSMLLLLVVAPVACTSNQPQGSSGARDDSLDAGQPAVIKDLTQAGVSSPHDGPLPYKASIRTFVPWDSVAILEVPPEGDPNAGALIVRYGKSWYENDGGPWTIYVLEAPGPEIEPISIEWTASSTSQFRVFARVDGTIRQYDFDRQ